MADAKFVVEDHRNGDAKIELDANKRFSGLTKEELLKYAKDPFWVKLRWLMFILFWGLWLALIGGAAAIIVFTPKCPAPEPKSWFQKGPLLDVAEANIEDIETNLPLLRSAKVQGIFVDVPTYDRDNPSPAFHTLVQKAKDYGIKVIVDLIPNYVPVSHPWFQKSENNSNKYASYFVWAEGKEFDDNGTRIPPNNWVSTQNKPAWTWSNKRGAYYLHQYGEGLADLNFNNEAVVNEFDNVLRAWMKAKAAGVRLHKARQLLVNVGLPNEEPATGRGSAPASDHTHYSYWRHRYSSDQPALDQLLARWADVVETAAGSPGNTVFTIAEDGGRPELFLLRRNLMAVRPLESAPIDVGINVTAAAAEINARLGKWPAMQLRAAPDTETELASLALLLPASPILDINQVEKGVNTIIPGETLAHMALLRNEASVEHGAYSVTAVPPRYSNQTALLAVARWKTGHTGYVAVFNPSEEEHRANLTSVKSLPSMLTLHHMSPAVKAYTKYTINLAEATDNVLVPPKSTVVLSYVPKISK